MTREAEIFPFDPPLTIEDLPNRLSHSRTKMALRFTDAERLAADEVAERLAYNDRIAYAIEFSATLSGATIVRAGGKGNYPLTNSFADRMRRPAATIAVSDSAPSQRYAANNRRTYRTDKPISFLLSIRFKTMTRCCSFLFNVIVSMVTFSLNS